MIANRELNQSSHDQVLVSAQESIQGKTDMGKHREFFRSKRTHLRRKCRSTKRLSCAEEGQGFLSYCGAGLREVALM